MEAGIKTFYSIPPLNDRVPSIAIDNFLVRLGFLKQKMDSAQNNGSDRLLGIFKHKS